MALRVIGIARSREAPLVLFLIAYAGELAVLFSMSYYPLDRYLYPMVPVVVILLLRAPPPSLSVEAMRLRTRRSSGSRHRRSSSQPTPSPTMRHGTAEATAVALGYDARTVDAGYEWVGSHGNELGTGTGTYGLMWYDDEFAKGRPCAVLSNSPLELSAYRLIRVDRSAYLQYLFFGRRSRSTCGSSIGTRVNGGPRGHRSTCRPLGRLPVPLPTGDSRDLVDRAYAGDLAARQGRGARSPLRRLLAGHSASPRLSSCL